MKQEALKTGMAICKHCGGTYNRKECIRIYGEFSAPAIHGFCSAACYTKGETKDEATPDTGERFKTETWSRSPLLNFSDTLVSYIKSSTGKDIAQLRGCTTGEDIEAEQNADMICAAPDMYRALKGIVDNWDSKFYAGEREELKPPIMPEGNPYWSPSASLVNSEYISIAREALKKASPNQ